MGRIYTVPMAPVAVTAQQDLFQVRAPSNMPVRLHEFHMSQSTEVGDAAEEGLSLLLKSGHNIPGAGGTGVTPARVAPGDAACSGTCAVNNTTKASEAGSPTETVTHLGINWNVRVPLDVIFTPESRIEIKSGGILTVELATTPADSITMSGWVVIEEIG